MLSPFEFGWIHFACRVIVATLTFGFPRREIARKVSSAAIPKKLRGLDMLRCVAGFLQRLFKTVFHWSMQGKAMGVRPFFALLDVLYFSEIPLRTWRKVRFLLSAAPRQSSSSLTITIKSELNAAIAPLFLSLRIVSPWHFLVISPDPHGQGRCPRYSSKQTALSSLMVVKMSVSSNSSP